ncbi:MAG: cation transporter [Bacteroidales bacterium]|nr:cation transporter [Bacteroidales bacterium]
MPDRARQIKRASWVAIVGNAVLALFKLVAGSLSGSLSVIADGIDSTGDVLISVMTLFIAYLLTKPPSVRFPYGYGKAEPNATLALAFIIFFAGAQLAISTINRFIEGSTSEMPGKLAIVAIVVSIMGKFMLAWYQAYVGKKVDSKMLQANAKNMQGDVVISSSVLAGLIFTHIFRLPVLDTFVAFFVSLWVIWVAVRIFIETNLELMDGNIEKKIYEQVFSLVESFPEVRNPHRMRIRKVGHRLMINIDVEADGKMSLKDAHDISHEIEKSIRDNLSYEVLDVILHVEPFGYHIDEQAIGISKKELHAPKRSTAGNSVRKKFTR